MIIIESPGGFPVGVTQENILFKNTPRNRRIAEVLQRCGLVERSGQGMDKIYSYLISESKPRPDFSKSDDFQVNLILKCNIQDKQFLIFLEKVINEKGITLTAFDLITLDEIRQGNTPSGDFQSFIPKLKELGIIELFGRGKRRKYIISKKYYSFIGEEGTYTRKKGLEKNAKRELILQHLKDFEKGTLSDFQDIFPEMDRHEIYGLLRRLKKQNKIEYVGSSKNGYWIILY